MHFGATSTNPFGRAFSRRCFDGRPFRNRGLYNFLLKIVAATSHKLTGKRDVFLQCPVELLPSYHPMGFKTVESHLASQTIIPGLRVAKDLVLLRAQSVTFALSVLTPDLIWSDTARIAKNVTLKPRVNQMPIAKTKSNKRIRKKKNCVEKTQTSSPCEAQTAARQGQC